MSRVAELRWLVPLAWCIGACSGASSEPKAVAPPPLTAAADASAHSPDPELGATAPTCDPTIAEVLFVPNATGFNVTILGEGFCVGAGRPSAKFGDLAVTNLVISSSGTSMAGRVVRMPPSGATLELHTPPGRPVVTSYLVP